MERPDARTAGTPAAGAARSIADGPAPRYAAIAGYALVAALARPLTLPALAAVLLPGVPLLWLGARRTPDRRWRVGRGTTVSWLALGVVFCLWELGAFLAGNDDAHPTFSILADPVLATYPGRAGGYLLWLGTGAWLVTR